MRELRQDSLTGAWMALCADRVGFRAPPIAEAEGPAACPLCATGEGGQLLGQRGRARAWSPRAPALRVELPEGPLGPGRRPGLGAHEVLTADDAHVPIHHLPVERAEDVLLLAVERMADLSRDRRLRTLAWSRRARPGAHGRDTVAAWPALPDAPSPVASSSVAHAIRQAHQDGREVGKVGAIHVWCSRAPRVPFEVRLAWLHDGGLSGVGEGVVADLARALHALELALEAEVGPHGHDVVLRRGDGPGPALLTGCLEVAPVTTWVPSMLGGVLPTHGAVPEQVAGALRDRFRRLLCHDAAQGEVDR